MPIQPTVLHPENNPDVDLHPETDAGQVTDFLNKTYPVGTVYMSIQSTSPASLFGGTWTRIQNGFLLSAGYDSISAGATGGSKTRALTRANLPGAAIVNGYVRDNTLPYVTHVKTVSTAYNVADILFVRKEDLQKIGQDVDPLTEAFDIMPPYLAIYIWKRVA